MFRSPFYGLLCSLSVLLWVACDSKPKQTGPRICKEFHGNGELRYEVPCPDGVFNGLYRQYNKKGEIWRETQYVNGVMEDTTRYYYSSTGEILKEIPMIQGEQVGEAIEYFKSGAIKQVITYKSGQRSGPMYTLSKKGDTTEFMTYLAGVPHGPVKVFRPDGSLMVVAEMESDSILSEMVYHPEKHRSLKPITFNVGDKDIPLVIPFNKEGLVVYFERKSYGRDLKVSVEDL